MSAVVGLLVALGGPSIAAGRQGAERPAQQPPIRVAVDYVQVDVTVTDRDGRFVRDLGADAFEIYEDGKRQQVSTFTLVDLPVATAVTVNGEIGAARIEPDVRTNDVASAGRVYLIVLDDLHVHPLRSARVKEAARKFVEKYFTPNDIGAVLHTSGRADASQEFTSQASLLLRSIDKFMGRKMRSSVLEKLAEYERRASTGASTRADIRLDRLADPLDAQRADQARRMLKTLAGISDLLARTEARRKAVLLISEGIDYPLNEGIAQTSSGLSTFTSSYAPDVLRDLQQAVRAAGRANVSIYPIDPRGLPGSDDAIEVSSFPENPHLGVTPTSFQDEIRQQQDSLRIMAEQTGGVASVASNDFDDAFNRIVSDSGTYYLLGYRPPDTSKDGRFRRIEVRVARKDVRVRARSGYVSAPPSRSRPELLTSKDEPSAALRDVLNTSLPVGSMPMRVFAAPFKGEKGGSVSVGVEIDGRNLRLTEEKGTYTGKLEVALVAFDDRARFATGDRQAVTLQLKPETYKSVQANGLRLLFRLNLAPGRYQLRAAGHEPASGATGSVFYDLEVPDFNAAPVTMSGLLLTVARAAQIPTARMDPLFQGVLPSPPTGLRSFRPGETLIALTEVYGSADAMRAGVDLVTTVRGSDGRVRSTTTDQSGVDEQATQSGAFGYAVAVPLADLPPGSYTLRVEARGRRTGGAAILREVPFQIAMPDSETK